MGHHTALWQGLAIRLARCALRYCLYLCLLLSALTRPVYSADTLRIAVASNFSATMNALATAYRDGGGSRLELVFGSSGALYAQVVNGAPFQALFSADRDIPEKLVAEGLALSNSRFTYASGTLVLWSSKRELVNRGEAALTSGKYNKLALANPALAPYGAAAVEVLRNLHLEQRTRSKWVLGENIAQTFQFVDSGNADLGFVALAQVMALDKKSPGVVWHIPQSMYHPLRQDAVILKCSPCAAEQRFFAFMKSAEAKKIIQSYGYLVEP